MSLIKKSMKTFEKIRNRLGNFQCLLYAQHVKYFWQERVVVHIKMEIAVLMDYIAVQLTLCAICIKWNVLVIVVKVNMYVYLFFFLLINWFYQYLQLDTLYIFSIYLSILLLDLVYAKFVRLRKFEQEKNNSENSSRTQYLWRGDWFGKTHWKKNCKQTADSFDVYSVDNMDWQYSRQILWVFFSSELMVFLGAFNHWKNQKKH